MVYFLSEDKIKEYLNDNIQSEQINNAIELTQTIYLKQIIGDSLYKKLEVLISGGDLIRPENEKYKTLLDEYIQPYLIYQSISDLVVPLSYKLGNVGLFQNYGENINSQGMSDIKFIESHWRNKASFFETRLTTYLKGNTSYFKEYNTCSDITPSRSSATSQTGLYLGGIYTGSRTINTGSNTGNNSGGNNNIDLNSYYTKDEVDALIENVGGDINLDNYYNKEETSVLVNKATEVIDLYSVDMNTLHEFITYLKANPTTKLTDKIVTYRGRICDGFSITGNNVYFYHNAFCFSEDKKNTDVSFTVLLMSNPAMPQFIQKSYIPDATGVANVVPTTNQMNTLIDNKVRELNNRIQELQNAINDINSRLEEI